MAAFFSPAWYPYLGDEFSALPLEQVPQRLEIRDQLIRLHDRVERAPGPHRAFDLHPHWNRENLTCYIFPNDYNSNRVREIFLRYGKSRAQIRALRDVEEIDSLRNHVHVAIGMAAAGFFFQLAFSRHAWLDYRRLLHLLRRREDQLLRVMEQLANAGYQLWWDDYFPSSTLTSAEALLNVLPGEDTRQGWLVFRRDINPHDPMLEESRILQSSLDEIARLYAAFNLVAVRSL